MQGRSLVVGSMSKGHVMTGSRLGPVIAPGETTNLVALLATNASCGGLAFDQDALFALCPGPEFAAEIAAPFARRRMAACDCCRDAQAL